MIVFILIRKHRNKRGTQLSLVLLAYYYYTGLKLIVGYEELSSDRTTTDRGYTSTEQSLLKGEASMNVKQGGPGVPSIRLQHDHTETITAKQ